MFTDQEEHEGLRNGVFTPYSSRMAQYLCDCLFAGLRMSCQPFEEFIEFEDVQLFIFPREYNLKFYFYYELKQNISQQKKIKIERLLINSSMTVTTRKEILKELGPISNSINNIIRSQSLRDHHIIKFKKSIESMDFACVERYDNRDKISRSNCLKEYIDFLKIMEIQKKYLFQLAKTQYYKGTLDG